MEEEGRGRSPPDLVRRFKAFGKQRRDTPRARKFCSYRFGNEYREKEMERGKRRSVTRIEERAATDETAFARGEPGFVSKRNRRDPSQWPQ